MPDLIYCAAGNKRFAEIAMHAGFLLGARLPGTVYFPLFFADQEFKKPNRAAYMAALAKQRPNRATVIDIMTVADLPIALDWAEEATQYTENVIIIPKVAVIAQIPRTINGKRVILGFSVPTRYGGTTLSPNQFAGWPVHLLGGSPNLQLQLYTRWFRDLCEIVSVDGNYHQMKATRFCEYWQHGKWVADGRKTVHDAPYAAFQRSCENIMTAWRMM